MTAAPIDRDREQVALLRALDAASAGLGSLVAVQGPAGIGKTTLLGWLRDAAIGRGFAVVGADAAIDGLLSRAARESVALVVDDLHSADAVTLQRLDDLARRVDGRRLLIVAGVQSPHPRGAEAELLTAILSGPYADVIEPGPLGDRGVDALLHRTFGRPCEAGFVTAAQNVSGGNPLLLRVLADEARHLGLRGVAADGQVLAELAAQGIDAILRNRRDRSDRPAA